MSGHVFITWGDLTKLHCDAWLLPCDAAFHVTPGWRASVSQGVCDRLDGLVHGSTPVPAEWGDSGERVLELADWPATAGEPRPYLVNVGAVADTPAEWYLEGVCRFFAFVGPRLPDHRVTERSKRPKPLVGVPLVGTGKGGAEGIIGAIVRDLLTVLYDTATTSAFDIVLVTDSRHKFVAAQNARRQLLDRSGGRVALLWPDLDDGLVSAAARLAAHAADEHLVLFLGAGVSAGAGLPTLDGLLDELAGVAGMDEEVLTTFRKLDPRDRAQFVEARLANQGETLSKVIVDRLASEHHALAHSLLAALPVREVVTMNYDTLFEEASAAVGREVAVLPYESVDGHSRWLLKLHGSVARPEDIVLTRQDYLRYADHRAALVGIVQALMITHDMLFVGFALADDNFHQIIDAVRKAIRGEGGRSGPSTPLGTALLVERGDLLERLWQGDLDVVKIAHPGQLALPDAARRLEIFLDYLLAETTRGTSPLLDRSYDGILTAEEGAIRALLERLEAGATDEIRRSAAWRPIAKLLRELGGSSHPGDLGPDDRDGLPHSQGNGQ